MNTTYTPVCFSIYVKYKLWLSFLISSNKLPSVLFTKYTCSYNYNYTTIYTYFTTNTHWNEKQQLLLFMLKYSLPLQSLRSRWACNRGRAIWYKQQSRLGDIATMYYNLFLLALHLWTLTNMNLCTKALT